MQGCLPRSYWVGHVIEETVNQFCGWLGFKVWKITQFTHLTSKETRRSKELLLRENIHAFRYYVRRFLQILDPSPPLCVSKISTVLDPHPPSNLLQIKACLKALKEEVKSWILSKQICFVVILSQFSIEFASQLLFASIFFRKVIQIYYSRT